MTSPSAHVPTRDLSDSSAPLGKEDRRLTGTEKPCTCTSVLKGISETTPAKMGLRSALAGKSTSLPARTEFNSGFAPLA